MSLRSVRTSRVTAPRRGFFFSGSRGSCGSRSYADEVLPGEVRLRCALDGGSQIIVFDACNRSAQLGGERSGRGYFAKRSAFGRTLGDIERSNTETKRVDGVTAGLEARDELGREHRELVRPHTRGD